jgi:tRNA (Thr-GGU) A37 N-methylase
MELMAIGTVQSPLRSRAEAPKQGDEGAPEAWLAFEPRFAAGLDGVAAGDEVLVLTWLDRAARDVLRVRPRSDAARPMTGVFATRSPRSSSTAVSTETWPGIPSHSKVCTIRSGATISR